MSSAYFTVRCHRNEQKNIILFYKTIFEEKNLYYPFREFSFSSFNYLFGIVYQIITTNHGNFGS